MRKLLVSISIFLALAAGAYLLALMRVGAVPQGKPFKVVIDTGVAIKELTFKARGFYVKDGCVVLQSQDDGRDIFVSCRVIAAGELAE